jgi:hypothetical protein
MRSFVLLWLACVMLSALENTNVAPDAAPPVLEEGVPFTEHVTVRNPHNRAVKITQLDSTCTCTRLVVHPELIPPGGTALLDVAIETANRSGRQEIQVSLFASDPELEPIEVALRWDVNPAVTVDVIRPGTEAKPRPQDRAWLDVYKFVARERPDELHRLRKRIRVASQIPGFRVEAVEYAGTLWAFTSEDLGDGVWLVSGKARDKDATVAEQAYEEQVVIRTNHPRKAAIPLAWITVIDKDTGREAVDPLMPLPMPMPGP